MKKYWNRGDEGASYAALGNGNLCVYERGPCVEQIFGPPYSAKSFFRALPDAGVDRTESERPFAAPTRAKRPGNWRQRGKSPM